MKFTKAISGGQTGADQTFVEEAAKLGLKTGGTMPKGFKTEVGPMKAWAEKYGLTEHESDKYPPRTWDNVMNSDVTVWFGRTTSAGFKCTKEACDYYDRIFYVNPTLEEFKHICNTHVVINGAGNRWTKNPAVVLTVREAFRSLKEV
jgi:hypothetical protein